ncbi:phospho-sugar mutase [Psychroflexus halocasei]|uniref:Phosphomannomutase n=1 Tax=Psychroflexus halocasei TaxID=908615 RepID=A0A1H4A1E8_9FLAO|nr:phospho-sugar mutase [Psychroflexus halocasei]SEA29638.1 Phosphomannomutase [Psychroflexus halocasei]
MKTLDKAKTWLDSAVFDQKTIEEVQELINNKPQQLEEAFYKNLEFGTGGMRGVMGAGTNRINKYTLGKNSQGIADYLKEVYPNEQHKVVIAYDCRHNSQEFAYEVAKVFSANGVQVYIFPELRPTPLLSYSVKHLGCHCGIVLTASHNPPEYNGYKVYWTDGGQLVPPQDKDIINRIDNLEFKDVNFNGNNDLIKKLGETEDEAFINDSIKNGGFNTTEEERKKLNISYTSLHGTSITIIPKVLKKRGYEQLHIVDQQAEPNGDFPTVESPNPEEPAALKMALELGEEKGSDLVVGTDPDSDRLGIAVRNLEGKLQLLNGNQTMVMMTWFLLEEWKKDERIKGQEFVASTIVSTPLMQVLTESYQVEYKESLTGFKWIAKLIKDNPELDFIGGGEESFGYMVGDFVRDKDAVTSILLVCEMAAQLKAKGSSIYEKMIELYVEHGYFKEHLVALVKKGIEGAEEIKQKMIDLRDNPLKEIDGEKIVLVEDYLSRKAKNTQTKETYDINVPQSNVLIYYTENGTKIAARPSGTEPKIKFYISVNAELKSTKKYKEITEMHDAKIKRIVKELSIA